MTRPFGKGVSPFPRQCGRGKNTVSKDTRKIIECKGQDVERRLEVTRGITSHHPNDGRWERSHLNVRRWESEKHRSWCIPVAGIRKPVATDCFLLGVPGKCDACGWSVVQLDHDEEMGPMHGMFGTLDAELEVQRAIKRAELTAFVCLFRKTIGLTTVHDDSKGITNGLWKGEMNCVVP